MRMVDTKRLLQKMYQQKIVDIVSSKINQNYVIGKNMINSTYKFYLPDIIKLDKKKK